MATNLDRFVFNSDYPMDKMVFYKQESITIPAKSGGVNGTLTVTIPHNLLFTPLPLAVWATSADFSDTRTLEPLPYNIGMKMVQADDTNITITFESSKATATDGFLRVYGLLPTDATQDAVPTSRQSSVLIFDTDKVYSPLIFSGILTPDLDSTNVKYINVSHGYQELIATAARVEIEHNLGRYPFITYWYEDNNGVIALRGYPEIVYAYPLTMYTYSDIDKCNFDCGLVQGKWHVRIYANV